MLALRNVIAGERHRFPELGATWQEEGPGRQHAALATALGRLDDRGLLRIPDMELAVLQLSGLVLSPTWSTAPTARPWTRTWRNASSRAEWTCSSTTTQ